MAISNTNLPQTIKPLSLPVLAFITLFLMLLNGVNSQSSLSFNLESFEPGDQNIKLQGDASISTNKVIELTLKDSDGNPLTLSVGRALYSTQLHLWDSGSGSIASFQTTFTFRLTSPSTDNQAHGLTFFIAPPGTSIPFNSTRGFFGFFNPETALNASANQIVFVEFDTYVDEWDPDYRHIGINVNTISSSANLSWERSEGETATTTITYNPGNGRLNVESKYPSSEIYQVSYFLNFKTILPEWVEIGFSASTGNYIQTHDILSWSFDSTLDTSRVMEEEEEKQYIAQKKQYIARYV